MLRIGVVGYGAGGRFFHTPFIQASSECELAGIVARSPEKQALIREDGINAPIYASLTEMLVAGVDAVVVTTPPHTRHDLVMEAIAAGVAVVADKPFAPDAAGGRALVEAAESAGVVLNVFHNRRWDTHLVTARALIDEGALAAPFRLDLRLDADDRGSLEAGPTGGLLRDLGSHVIDQALSLFGPAVSVSAYIDWIELPEGRTDAGFVVNLRHASGAHSHVSASKLNRLESHEVRVHAENGSYVSDYTDVQAEAIFAGRRPADDRAAWGYEVEDRWGVLTTDDGTRVIPSRQGDYTVFYDLFAEAVAAGGPGPVPAREGVAVLEILDAARISADEGRTVALPSA